MSLWRTMSRTRLVTLMAAVLALAACRGAAPVRSDPAEPTRPPTGWWADRLLFLAGDPPGALSVTLVRVSYDDEVVRRYRIVRVDGSGRAVLFEGELHGGGDPAGVPPHEGFVFERQGTSQRVRWRSTDRRVEIVLGEGTDLHGGLLRVAPGRGGEDWMLRDGRVLWSGWADTDGAGPPPLTEVLLFDEVGDGWVVRADGVGAYLWHWPVSGGPPLRYLGRWSADGPGWTFDGPDGWRLELVAEPSGPADGDPERWVTGRVSGGPDGTRVVQGILVGSRAEAPPPSPGPRDRERSGRNRRAP